MYVPSLIIYKEGDIAFPKIPKNKEDMDSILKAYGINK